jgi:hypothetical protein
MIRSKVKFSLDLCCYSDGNNRNKIILAILTYFDLISYEY